MTATAIGDSTSVALPALSVVIPLYGGADFITDTLAALHNNTPAPFEVIVVDNASPDGAGAIVDRAADVNLVSNERNLGFGVACNQGATLARADVLCFLNSDARVEPGWFEPLREALATDPAAAVAVPRYLEPDGRLQEAGAVIDGTGEGVLLGHGAATDDARYRFARYVEYGSAACLVIRRNDFETAGGFDPAFGLAYYEDADLEIRLGNAGRRVRFVPSSTVTHTRGASASTPALTELRTRNRALMRARHTEPLADRPVNDDLLLHPERVIQLRDAGCPQRTLVCVNDLDINSDMGRVIVTLARLWPENRTTVISCDPVDEPEPWQQSAVELADGHADWSGWLRGRIGQASVVWTVGTDAHTSFDDLIETTQPQAVRVHWPEPATANDRSDRLPTTSREADLEASAQADLVVDAAIADRLRRSPETGLTELLAPIGWPLPH